MARAKFVVQSVNSYEHQKEVVMNAQYSPSNQEDNAFSNATPWGEFKMAITNEALYDFFVPGKAYYLDISPVPEA